MTQANVGMLHQVSAFLLCSDSVAWALFPSCRHTISIYVQTATAWGVSFLLEGAPSLPLVSLPYSWLNHIITQSKKCSLVLFLKKMRHWILMGFSTQHSEVWADGAACSTVWENQKTSRVRTLLRGFAIQNFIYVFSGSLKLFYHCPTFNLLH